MQSKTQNLTLAAVCAALMAAGAYLRFPLPLLTVQLTTQVFFLLVTGLLLPPGYAAGAMAAYVLTGLAGFPMFSRGGGLQTVLTPEFGYLLGFVLSAFLTALAREKMKARRFGNLLPAVIGVFAVYAAALPYAALLAMLYAGKPIAFSTLMTGYFLAFLPLDLVKAFAAAAAARQVRKALRLS